MSRLARIINHCKVICISITVTTKTINSDPDLLLEFFPFAKLHQIMKIRWLEDAG